MKLLCVLILFALANVLVAELDESDKQVIIANEYIKRAGADLTTVIKNIVLGNFTMVEMALMLAVPDTEEDVRIEHKMIDYQHIIQNQVWYITGAVFPDINEDDFKDVKVTDLAKSRRFFTKAAVKAMIRVAMREGTTLSEEFKDFLQMCRLIGLYRSIKYLDSLIKSAKVRGEICFLKTQNNKTSKYKQINGSIYELNLDDTPFRLLSSKVQ